jgi:GNAT superfamily N-acetyltransferase
MIGWAVEYFRGCGCYAAQLTSNNDRSAAHRFYERLGWEKSHSGFKLKLTKGD